MNLKHLTTDIIERTESATPTALRLLLNIQYTNLNQAKNDKRNFPHARDYYNGYIEATERAIDSIKLSIETGENN